MGIERGVGEALFDGGAHLVLRTVPDDREPRAFPGGVGDHLMDVPGAAELEDPEHERQQDRDEQRELHERLPSLRLRLGGLFEAVFAIHSIHPARAPAPIATP